MTLQTILTAQKLAQSLNVPAPKTEDAAMRSFRGINTLEFAGSEEISFVAAPKYLPAAAESLAGLLLCPEKMAGALGEAVSRSRETDRVILPVPSVWVAVIHILNFFHPEPEAEGNVHQTAIIPASVDLGDPVDIGPWTNIGEDAQIGDNCVIGARCSIGARVKIGPGCRVGANVYIHDDTEIGARCRLSPGVVIGADGFRYEQVGGASRRVPQVGRVVLEDDVDVGANSAIDRAGFAETRIGARTKIDNLVQVGHNVVIGPDCILCGQAGIAGSSRLGRGVIMGGQTAVPDHLSIADGTILLGQAGTAKDITKPNQAWFGTPCEPSKQWFRKQALLGQLGGLKKRIEALEKANQDKAP